MESTLVVLTSACRWLGLVSGVSVVPARPAGAPAASSVGNTATSPENAANSGGPLINVAAHGRVPCPEIVAVPVTVAGGRVLDRAGAPHQGHDPVTESHDPVPAQGQRARSRRRAKKTRNPKRIKKIRRGVKAGAKAEGKVDLRVLPGWNENLKRKRPVTEMILSLRGRA